MAILSQADLNRATLARQMLLAREKLDAITAIERLGGLQAQAPRPPFVGLWTRLQGFRRSELIETIHQRKVVRATLQRGTLHLWSTRDYLAHRPALQPILTSLLRGFGERAKRLDLPKVLDRARALFAREAITFETLREELTGAFPDYDDFAMGLAARMHLPLVMVPTGDPWGWPAAATFTLAEEWLGQRLAEAQGPEELVLRYLAAFGPATPADAQKWSGFSSLRAVFERLRPKLVTFRDAEKRELFDLPDAPRPPRDTPAPVRFLADFDNLLLSHDDRTRVLADEHQSVVFTKNGIIRPTILVNGVVAGLWRVERKKDLATLCIEPFGTLTKKVRAALEEEGEPLVGFVEPEASKHAVAFA